MAGGSQIIINKDGITLITPGKFEPKAGQHLFKGGEKLIILYPRCLTFNTLLVIN